MECMSYRVSMHISGAEDFEPAFNGLRMSICSANTLECEDA